ncbi:MAG: efflux RND transporter permease subunit [Breznakibacter sp.]
MKSIARFAIDNPVTVWMFILAVGLLGFISLSKLGTDLFPNLNSPRLYVELTAGERTPEEIETRLVENIEALAIRQKGVVAVKSDVSVGVALVTIEYNFGQNMDEAFLDMQKALASLEQNSEVDEFSISRFDPNASPVVEAALVPEGNLNMNELRKLAEKYIVNDLVRLDGIADVKLSGGLEPQVIIQTNPDVLEVNGLTSSDITSALSSYNRNVSGGYIEESGQRYIIKGTAVFKNPSDLNNLVIGYRSSTGTTSTSSASSVPILLSEVASVSLGTSEPENIVSLDGKQCLGVAIYKETNYNTVNAVKAVDDEFARLEKRLPGYRLVMVNNQGTVISDAINEVKDSALIGMLLAVAVLFVFLRRIGVTLVVSIAMPISIIATFNLMYFNGLTLNVMTLGGLALGAGMLVDNAVVAMENIFRMLEQGKPLREAIIEGIDGIGGALVASTLTTVVVFLPVVYLQGASGELFKDQAWTVAFALMSSLFVAILLIPVMVNLFFSKKKSRMEQIPKGLKFLRYGNWLNSILAKRDAVLIATLVVMGITFYLVRFVGSEFMPSYQTKELNLSLKLPAGTALARTADVADRIGQVSVQLVNGRIAHVYTHVGPGSSNVTTTGQTSGNNTGTIKLLFGSENAVDVNNIILGLESMFKDVPGLNIDYKKGGSGLTDILGTDEAPFEVQVIGNDLQKLIATTGKVKQELQQIGGLALSYSSFEEGAPEVAIKIDRYRAGMYNIDVSTIMSQISQFLQGTDGGNMDVEGELVDIRLKMPDVTLEKLNQLKITSGTNQYMLTELAQISIGEAPAQLTRVNQSRVGKIQGYPLGDKPFSLLVNEVRQSLANVELPDGFQVKIAGQELQREESFDSLMFALILAVVLVYMVMAAQFESLLHPFTILLSIPMAGVGVVWLFLATGQHFNIMALIGVVMLGGIAVNNAILLVDAINRNKWAGMDRRSAIVAAGQQRIRPILMTSATTVLALLPLTFGFGESASLRSPMALAVIGGMVTSTLLTLVVIPCVYDLFDRILPEAESQHIDQ